MRNTGFQVYLFTHSSILPGQGPFLASPFKLAHFLVLIPIGSYLASLSPHPPPLERQFQDGKKNILHSFLPRCSLNMRIPSESNPPTPHNPIHSGCSINTRRHVIGHIGIQAQKGGCRESTGGGGGGAGRNGAGGGEKGSSVAPTSPR